jgi:hypothetical protein
MTWLLGLAGVLPNGAKAALAGAAGFVAAIAAFSCWNALVENPHLKHEVRVTTEARMMNRFNQAVGELTDAAAQARIRLRLCTESGGVYDFEAGDCRKR